MIEKFKVTCLPENASRFRMWIRERGGVAVWPSQDLSDPGQSWSSPALQSVGGVPMTKPTWQCSEKPEVIITSEADVGVVTWKEVKRFHVAIRRSGSGLQFKLTDASSRKLRAELEKAGENSQHDFDGQDAVVLVPESVVALSEWKEPS